MISDKLKKSFLQAAIQGKLTEQLPQDGDARDLLQEIQGQKSRLLKDGKIKSMKSLLEITVDGLPFDIPKNWCWAKLGTITKKLTDGSHAPPPNSGFGYPVISVQCIENGKINLQYVNRYTDEIGFKKENPKTNISNGDIILGIVGSIGSLARYDQNVQIIAQRSVAVIRSLINDDYLYFVLASPYIQNTLETQKKGTAQFGVYLESLKELIIPIPPLLEQIRIVNCLERALPELEILAIAEKDLDTLQRIFPQKMKDSIMQYAIQGRLTQQLRSEGNARDLLKEIQKEKDRLVQEGKIRKEKPLSEIREDEIPFDIPENWCWIRLGQIAEFQKGFAFKSSEYRSSGIRIAKITNLTDKDSAKNVYVANDTAKQYKTFELKVEDLVLTTVGSWPTCPLSVVGNVFQIEKKFDGSLLNQNAVRIRPFTCIYKKYVFYVLKSKAFKKYIIDISQGTANQASITQEDLKEYAMPIPPFLEQKRIVERLEELLPVVAKLQTNEI